jgi:photosystem II stability/assembly factor-like uncharacterized protein
MALALSHGAETIYSSEALSDRVLVGTIDGIADIKRDGDSWIVANRTLEGSHIHAILHEPQSGFWFAAVQKGGIYVSRDDGSTWEACNNGLTETDMYSLATAKVKGRVRLFAGTEPVHLFFSDDLGAIWSEMQSMQEVPGADNWRFPAPPHVGHLKHINFGIGDPQTIFASVEQGGLYVSHDGGKSFGELPAPIDDVHRVVISTTHPSRMYTTGGGGLSMTEDAGQTWANIFGYESPQGGYPDQLVFKPSDPDYMIVAAGQKSPSSWRKENNALSRISRSRDAGRTWEVLTGGLPDYMTNSVEAMCIEEAGSTVQIFAANTGGEIWWSQDAGDSWAQVIDGLPPISKGGHYRGMVEAGHSAR